MNNITFVEETKKKKTKKTEKVEVKNDIDNTEFYLKHLNILKDKMKEDYQNNPDNKLHWMIQKLEMIEREI